MPENNGNGERSSFRLTKTITDIQETPKLAWIIVDVVCLATKWNSITVAAYIVQPPLQILKHT